MSDSRTIAPQADRESAASLDDKLELRLWLRLLTCSNLIEGLVRANLREEFLTTLPRFDLLAQLDRSPDGLTMSELSARMMVSNGNITGLTDRLVEEGLVKRMTAEDDRRRMHVRLTPAGKKAFDQMTPAHESWIEAVASGLSRAEMQQLMQLLAKLKQSALAAVQQNTAGGKES